MSVIDRLNVTVNGQGDKPIVFAHGFGCDQSSWRLVAPAFFEDYRVVLFDYFGADPGDRQIARYNSIDAYADDVLSLVDELDLRDAVFVGHSISAMIGLRSAVKRPAAFERLVLVAPTPRFINDDGYHGGFEREDIDGLLNALENNLVSWSHELAPAIMGNEDRPELGRELTASFCRMDPEAARGFARMSFLTDSRDDVVRTRAPALIMQCRDDILAPPAVGAYLNEHMANSTLVVMEATGHCPNLSAPAEIVSYIKKFLKEEPVT